MWSVIPKQSAKRYEMPYSVKEKTDLGTLPVTKPEKRQNRHYVHCLSS